MTSNVFRGTIPALMTPCRADRSPDFEALARRGRALVDAGMSAVVYCGSMGDWPLLTDEQRRDGVARLVKDGLPVIVGTGAQNPAIAAAHAAHARAAFLIENFASAAAEMRRAINEGALGAAFAEKAKAAGVTAVVFDRSGAPYHGKVKTFAEAAREGGLKF